MTNDVLNFCVQWKPGGLERPPKASTFKTSWGPAQKVGGRAPPVIRPLVTSTSVFYKNYCTRAHYD